MLEYVAVLLPSVAVGVIFYFVMRSIFNADRTEREAMSQAEERLAQPSHEGVEGTTGPDGTTEPR